MPATIDDLLASMQQLNGTVQQLLVSQQQGGVGGGMGGGQGQGGRRRRKAWWSRQPRQLVRRGVGKMLRGNLTGGRKQFGKAWQRFKKNWGFGSKKGGKGNNLQGQISQFGKAWQQKNRAGTFAKGGFFKGKGAPGAGGRGGKAVAVGAAGRAAGLAAGLGAVANVAGLVVAALVILRHAAERLSEAQLAAARHYAEMSPSTAAAVAQRDVRELMRDMEKGERTSGARKMALDSEQDRKDNTKEFDIAVDNIGAYLTTALNYTVTAVMAPLEAIATVLNTFLDISPWRDRDKPATAAEYLLDVEARNRAGMLERQKAMEAVATAAAAARKVK